MNRFILQCVLILTLILSALTPISNANASAQIPEDKTKAVILAYHRIGEDHLPGQSLTIEQFNQHIQEIKGGNYNILPLSQIIEAIQTKAVLPPNTLAITFEGAHRSAIEKAVPLLLESKIPFTLFYASDSLDQNDPGYASWYDLKALKRKPGVEIATLPAVYSHTARQPEQTILASLNKARQRHREEFQQEAAFLSYPYGEYSVELKKLAKSQGYTAAFGLHSGATYSESDLFALPRFSMTELYGDLERFRMVTRAHPLPVNDLEPANTDLGAQRFHTGFTLPKGLQNKTENLSCFISGQGKALIEKFEGGRIEIRTEEILTDQTRIRLNCTMPGPLSEDDEIQWRWLGLLYHRAEQPPIEE